MITQHALHVIVSSLVLSFSVCLLSACKPTAIDPRADLVKSLKGEHVEDFDFEMKEDRTEETTSLTNRAVKNIIKFDKSDRTLVLRYTRVLDRVTKTTRTYKTEVTKAGAKLTFLVTDIGKNEVVIRETFPAPIATHESAFDSIEDCLREFDCVNRGPLQCEANRTCKDQYAAITCCLRDGQCFSVHLVIKPTSFRCKLPPVTPDFEGLVMSQ